MNKLRIGSFALVSSLFASAAQANLVTLNFNDFTTPYETYLDEGLNFHEVYEVDNVQLRHLGGPLPDGSARHVYIYDTEYARRSHPCRGCSYAANGSGVLQAGYNFELTTGGGLFTLEAIDLLQGYMNRGSLAIFESYLDGQLTGTFSFQFSNSLHDIAAHSTWRWDVSGLSLGVMDRLVFKGDRGTLDWDSSSNFWVDNLRVNSVPEPDSLALLSAAVFGAGFVGWRRKKATQA